MVDPDELSGAAAAAANGFNLALADQGDLSESERDQRMAHAAGVVAGGALVRNAELLELERRGPELGRQNVAAHALELHAGRELVAAMASLYGWFSRQLQKRVRRYMVRRLADQRVRSVGASGWCARKSLPDVHWFLTEEQAQAEVAQLEPTGAPRPQYAVDPVDIEAHLVEFLGALANVASAGLDAWTARLQRRSTPEGGATSSSETTIASRSRGCIGVIQRTRDRSSGSARSSEIESKLWRRAEDLPGVARP